MSHQYASLLAQFRDLFVNNQGLTAEEIQFRFAPFALGNNNDGLIFPTVHILRGNAACDQWCDLIAYYNVNHLRYWLNLVNQYDPSMFIVNFIQSIGPYGCQEHYLPIIEYIQRPEYTLVHTCTMLELVQIYNMRTVAEFATYLYSLLILGVFLNNTIANEVFMIQNQSEFIASRLFQGELDAQMAGGFPSAFLGFGSPQNVYDSEPFYTTLSGPISTHEFDQLLSQEKQVIMRSQFLGNSTAQVLAMKDALQLPETYTQYITKRGPVDAMKVGPAVYESISLGSSSQRDKMTKTGDRREVNLPVIHQQIWRSDKPPKEKIQADPNYPYRPIFSAENISAMHFFADMNNQSLVGQV